MRSTAVVHYGLINPVLKDTTSDVVSSVMINKHNLFPDSFTPTAILGIDFNSSEITPAPGFIGFDAIDS
jgi:hypothetical protein